MRHDMGMGRGTGDDAAVSVRVRVIGGVLQPETEGDLTVFRGIPYATLPVRFGTPEAVRPWGGVLSATAFGPPPQSGMLGTDAMSSNGDEWLTVNVWSRDPRSRPSRRTRRRRTSTIPGRAT